MKIIGIRDYTIPMFGNKRSESHGKLIVAVNGSTLTVPICEDISGQYVTIKRTRHAVQNMGTLYSPQYVFEKDILTLTCSCCGNHRDIVFTQISNPLDEGWNSFGSALYCPECSRTWYERNTKDLAGRHHTMGIIHKLFHRLNG